MGNMESEIKLMKEYQTAKSCGKHNTKKKKENLEIIDLILILSILWKGSLLFVF